MANSIGDWFKRYWVWITLVFIGLVALIVYILFPTGDSGTLKVLKDTEEKVKALRDSKKAELDAIDASMAARTQELKIIKATPSEQERLDRLADFANRKHT